MFCSSCGATLPDSAKFCFNCGAKSGSFDLSNVAPGTHQTKIVPAKCTNCGASLSVGPTQSAAVCPYCNSAYVVEKAINEYNLSIEGNLTVNGATININGKNLSNLLERAEQYAHDGDFDKATQYFNEILDIDVNSVEAVKGIQRIKEVINDYVFMSEDTPSGKLELKKDRLILTTSVSPQLYELKRIFDLNAKSGFFSKSIQFTYSGMSKTKMTIATENPNQWFKIIEDAKMGKYPKMTNLGELYAEKA